MHSTASHLKQVLKTPVSAGRDAVEVENLVADALKVKLKISTPDLEGASSLSFRTCDSQLLQVDSVEWVSIFLLLIEFE